MEIVQILIGSMFSLIAMACVLYLAFRAHTIAGDLTEIKELLKDSKRASGAAPAAATEIASLDRAIIASTGAAAASIPTSRHAPGEWPSVMDPDYNVEDISSKPSGSPR